jgi:hypothetical protein
VGDGRVTVLLAAVLLAATCTIVYLVAVRVRQAPDPLVRRRVVVHTKDDSSIRGVLTATHADCYLIGRPEYLNEAAPQELQGEALVLRSNVSWIQILGGE